MATALQTQGLGLASSIGKVSSHWLERTATPRGEARLLFRLVGSNGDTIESIRELIAVPQEIEERLGLYAKRYPEEAPTIEKVLSFRKRVREEFDRLCACGL
jgi:hypothetical protein